MKRRGSALVLALLASHAAQADDAPEALATVEVVGVAPGGAPGIARRLLPYAVQTASAEQIGASGSGTLAEFMARRLDGVNVNDISGSPFQTDLTYRGFRASPVLGAAQGMSVYLDGVRINEPFGDVVNWDMLPEAAIGKLALVPGSNPLYGLNTLGGALALESKSGATDPGTGIDASLGQYGRRRLDLAHGAVHGAGWHSFIASTLFDEQGWRAHSQGRLANVFLKLGRERGNLDWSVSLTGGRSRLRGNGLLPDEMAAGDWGSSYSFPDETRNRLLQLAARGTLRLDGESSLTAQAYARSSRRDTVNGDVQAGDEGPEGEFNTTSTRQRSQGASVQWTARRGGHRIDAGATFDRSSVSFAQFEQDGTLTAAREIVPAAGAERTPASSVTGSSRALGVFGADTWSLGPDTHLTATARLNRAQVGNTLTTVLGAQPPERFTYTKFNPALGLAHALGRGWTASFNAAQGNRVPTVIELGCADPAQPCRLPVGLQSDPYLRQVVSRTLEAGVRFERGTTHAAFALYRTVNRDDILFVSSGPSRAGYFANVDKTRHQGLDANVSTVRGAWTLRAGYSYLDAAYAADGVLFTGLRTVQIKHGTALAGLPRHTLKLGAEWQPRAGWRLGADLDASSSLPTQGNEDGLVADPVDGALLQRADLRVAGRVLLHVRASWDIAPGWELYARVNNVTDRRYASFGAVGRNLFPSGGEAAQDGRFVAPGAPRTVAAGLRYRY
jgi:outer membrane receptor protein involved in Fe transport